MAEVKITKLTKKFGNTVVVQDFDLTIKNSEFVVFVGPSGCGKSTTLRMVAGLEEITSGDIVIDGKLVNNVHPKSRDIAMVFQSYALYPHMNVFDNISFGLRAQKLGKPEIEKRTNEAAAILGLEELLARRPGELSGGQKQRVAMGRAIVRKPKVFLFDEPLSNLDAKLRHKMRAEMKLLHQQVQTTTIYVTHDQVEAMTLADRIVIMYNGRVEQVGTPDEVYKTPKTQFVAGFIGSPAMNFVTGIVEAAGRGTALKTDDGSVIAMPKCLAKVGKRVTVGFRPEHMQLASTTTKPKSAISVSVTPSVIEPMGHETIVTCNAPFGEITSRITEEVKLRVGRELQFHVASDKLHFFDDKTGKRME